MPRLVTSLALFGMVVLLAAACGGGSSSSSGSGPTVAQTVAPATTTTAPGTAVPAAIVTKPVVTVPSGPPPTQLVSKDLVVGTGATAKSGDNLVVQYVGVAYSTGKQFDASWNDGPSGGPQPFPFQVGTGGVIKGWDTGIPGMKVGGRRELIIPPDLAYGAQGQGPIGPNETLIFVVDLLSIG